MIVDINDKVIIYVDGKTLQITNIDLINKTVTTEQGVYNFTDGVIANMI